MAWIDYLCRRVIELRRESQVQRTEIGRYARVAQKAQKEADTLREEIRRLSRLIERQGRRATSCATRWEG